MQKKGGLDENFRELLNNDSIVAGLIQGDPKKIFDINCSLVKDYTKGIEKNTQKYFEKLKKFNDEAKSLFVESGYTKWFLKTKQNYTLATKLSRDTCTYCNRQYIFTLKKNGENSGMVPQFGHWFPKGTYPLLALSFYNLIPSCSICNGSSIKGENPLNLKDHFHPYVDEEISDLFQFSFFKKSLRENIIQIKQSPFNPKIKRTADELQTELLYKGHASRELQDLIDLRYKYSQNYLDILFNKTFKKGNLVMSEAEKYRLIFGIETERDNYHKRPLSKFKHDIIKELLNIK
ncbi:hypothetical protein [Salegentibacter mishustinae]|nr:hypothetical protein [Salegentibacter mishustinae]